MTTHRNNGPTRFKAASAALAFIALAAPSCALGADISTAPLFATIPATPDEEEAMARIRRAFDFRLAETPQLIEEFRQEFPATPLRAEATLLLADWHFFLHEYPTALKYYSEIPDGAFSGSTRHQMLYRKALSMLKTGYYAEASRLFATLAGNADLGGDARFYLAYIDYVNGNYDSAYTRFKEIAGRRGGSKDAEAEYYINQIDYRNGEYRRVANTTERLLSTGNVPDELKAETMRVGGLANFKLGDKTTARRLLGQYADLAGDGAEISALYALATVYYDEGNYDKALPLFSTVTEYPGDLAQSAWLYIGQIYIARGDAQSAALAFDKAAKESWDGEVAETAAYNLAVASASGMGLPFSDAAKAMENFVDTYPASPYAASLSRYLANAYYANRDYRNALRQIEKVQPQDAAAKALRQKISYQLGATLLRQGDISGAIKSLSEASRPSTPDAEVAAQASLWLGDAHFAARDYRAAAKAYEEAIASKKLGDNTALAYYDLGYADMKLKRYTAAEDAFRTACSIPSGTLSPSQKADARLRYADCLYYNGKYSQALSIFRDIKLDGGQDAVFAQIREADILGREGRVNEKISILEGLAANPDAGIWRSTALSRLADAYSERGDDRKAAELYATILESNPRSDNSQTYYALAANAENLYQSGDREAALAAYRQMEKSGIAALYPQAVKGVMRTAAEPAEIYEYAAKTATLPGLSPEETDEALYTGAVAALQLDAGNRNAALATLEALALSADRDWGARAAVALGEHYLSQGNLAEAEKVLLDLVDTGSDNSYWLARGYITLADVYAAQEKDYLARLYLETLQSNYPGTEKEIKQMINSRLKKLDK